MKTLYEIYQDIPFLPPVVAEMGWTQNILILEKCKDNQSISFCPENPSNSAVIKWIYPTQPNGLGISATDRSGTQYSG
jgi:hypothetical protein